MEPLGRWLRREREREQPWPLVILAFGSLFPLVLLVPRLFFAPGQSLLLILSSITILILGWTPLIFHAFRNRHRPKTVTLIGAHIRGHFSQALGPQGPELNQAATDLEQITASLRLSNGNAVSKKAIIQAAELRMRRMFDLTYGAPALQGLSQESAQETFASDLQWLEDVRKACERLPLPQSDRESSDAILADLREHIAAREAAVEELKLQ